MSVELKDEAITCKQLCDLFEKRLGYKPNLDHPQSFNEKLLKMKLAPVDPLMQRVTDKCEAKRYVKDVVSPIPSIYEGTDYNPKSYPFIAKPNASSNRTRLILDGSDWLRFQKLFEREQERTYGWSKGEWNYQGIENKYLIEPILPDYRDYKLMCFHGKVKIIQMLGRRGELDSFKLPPAESNGVSHFWSDGQWIDVRNAKWPTCERVMEHDPEPLIRIAEKLAEPFEFVRIDLLVGEKIYFGEFSLFIGGGHTQWDPPSFDWTLGALL